MRIRRNLFFICFLLLPAACHKAPQAEEVFIVLKTEETRSGNPPEEIVDDVNLFIFNGEGVLKEHLYMKEAGNKGVRASLFKEEPYTIYACANLGYRMPERTMEEMDNMRFFLTYPDEFSHGMPMSGIARDVTVGEDKEITLEIRRCMAKVEVRLDRSGLYSGIDLEVKRVETGACPRWAFLFRESKVLSSEDLFLSGYYKDGRALNTDAGNGLSRPETLYLLENCQGNLLEDATGPEDKIFPALDRTGELCSWIEIHATYYSSRYYTRPGEFLVYRFYLGEDLCNFDVRRNVSYSFTVRPEGNGLNESSWRVDRSAIEAI